MAIGFLDYIQNPKPILARLSALTKDVLYLSFPKRWTARTVPRKLRLALNGCYVRFYARQDIHTLLQGIERKPSSVLVTPVNRDFLVKVRFS